MLALALYESDRCGGCGGLLLETTDPGAEDMYRAELPVRCHRCTAIAEAVDRYRDTTHPHALMFPVKDLRDAA